MLSTYELYKGLMYTDTHAHTVKSVLPDTQFRSVTQMKPLLFRTETGKQIVIISTLLLTSNDFSYAQWAINFASSLSVMIGLMQIGRAEENNNFAEVPTLR